MTGITGNQWDDWRNDPLTKACLKMLVVHANRKYGYTVTRMAEATYSELFSSTEKMIRYATLRGRIEGVNDVLEALSDELADLMELTDNNDEKNQPRDV